MNKTFKIWLEGDQEHFSFEEAGRHASFPFAHQLMEFLYLDVSTLTETEQFNKHFQQFRESRDSHLRFAMRDDLAELGNRHLFFIPVFLKWRDFFSTATPEQEILDMPYKKITHIPANVQTLQGQVKDLLADVLDPASHPSPKEESAQERMIYHLSAKKERLFGVYEFDSLTTRFEQVSGSAFTEVLYPRDFYDAVEYFVRTAILREVHFKVCKNCGRYFAVLGYSNTEYCDRPFENTGKTCKEVGAAAVMRKKAESTPALKVYQREYKKRFAWIKYRKWTKEQFDEWSGQARKLRDEFLAGQLGEKKFLDWLKN